MYRCWTAHATTKDCTRSVVITNLFCKIWEAVPKNSNIRSHVCIIHPQGLGRGISEWKHKVGQIPLSSHHPRSRTNSVSHITISKHSRIRTYPAHSVTTLAIISFAFHVTSALYGWNPFRLMLWFRNASSPAAKTLTTPYGPRWSCV